MPEVISGAMRPPFAGHKCDADRSRLAVRQEMRRVSLWGRPSGVLPSNPMCWLEQKADEQNENIC